MSRDRRKQMSCRTTHPFALTTCVKSRAAFTMPCPFIEKKPVNVAGMHTSNVNTAGVNAVSMHACHSRRRATRSPSLIFSRFRVESTALKYASILRMLEIVSESQIFLRSPTRSKIHTQKSCPPVCSRWSYHRRCHRTHVLPQRGNQSATQACASYLRRVVLAKRLFSLASADA